MIDWEVGTLEEAHKPSRFCSITFQWFSCRSRDLIGMCAQLLAFQRAKASQIWTTYVLETILQVTGGLQSSRTTTFVKPSRVSQHNFLMVQLQIMRFGRNVRLVVSFPNKYSKLDLDNLCVRNNSPNGCWLQPSLRWIESIKVCLKVW